MDNYLLIYIFIYAAILCLFLEDMFIIIIIS